MRSKANSAAFLPDATGQCDLEFIVSFQNKKISWEMPVKGYFLMRFSFDRLLDFDRKTAYSKWYFSVADRQRRCAVCLGSHFALICLFLRLNKHSEIFLFCCDWLFRIRKMLLLVCSAFCIAYCLGCCSFSFCFAKDEATRLKLPAAFSRNCCTKKLSN